MKNYKYITIIITLLLLVFNCREEIELETQDFESVLVVESTITNELKKQEVKLSRTYLLSENESLNENNAEVRVVDDLGNSYNFTQNEDGIYESDIEFMAQNNRLYTLNIITGEGKQYSSITTSLTPISQINNLYTEYVNDEINGPGIQVYIDSDNTSTNAKYFRYEWQETYKVVVPLYFEYEAILTDFQFLPPPMGEPDPGAVAYNTEFVLRNEQQQTCFRASNNTEIIQNTTNDLDQNIVLKFPIHFIESTSHKIRERYSILIKQYSQSIEAYTFYKIMSQFGNIESILSENQPGFIEGNLFSINNETEKVIGFFDVSSVAEERIFFNYFDFGLSQPDYLYECEIIELDYNMNFVCGACTPPFNENQRQEIHRLLTQFEEENLDYHIIAFPLPNINSIWKISNPQCTDCTSIEGNTNIQPSFWID